MLLLDALVSQTTLSGVWNSVLFGHFHGGVLKRISPVGSLCRLLEKVSLDLEVSSEDLEESFVWELV